jgi:hypothetical protein
MIAIANTSAIASSGRMRQFYAPQVISAWRALEERKLPYAKEPAGITAETSSVILQTQR